MMQSTHTNRINSGRGHCALPKRQLQTDLGCALTIPGAAIPPVWQRVPRAHAYSHAASPLSPHGRGSTCRRKWLSWTCELHPSPADTTEHGTLWHCPRHLSRVRRSATRRWHFCRCCSALPRRWPQGMGCPGGRSQPEERGGAGDAGCRCGEGGTEGLEEGTGRLRWAEPLQPEEGRLQKCGGAAAQPAQGGGCGWALGMRLIGTWPAMSDVGRRTPVLKRGWQHKDRCVPLVPIPFSPSSPNLFTRVQKTASQSRGAG